MIVMVAAEKGGVGKTSICVNLAAIAAGRGIQCILLDGDSTRSSTSWAKIRAEAAVKPEISIASLDWKADATVPKTLADMSTRYDLVLLDLGARSYETMMRSALLADLILVPLAPGQFEAESTANLFDALRQLDARHKRGRVPAYAVLNMLPTNNKSREEGELRAWLQDQGIPAMASALRHRKAWRDVSRTGLAVNELRGRDAAPAAREEMLALYEEAERVVDKEVEAH